MSLYKVAQIDKIQYLPLLHVKMMCENKIIYVLSISMWEVRRLNSFLTRVGVSNMRFKSRNA